MVDERIRTFFDWLVARLFEGELDWLEEVYVYPYSIFIGDEIRLETVPEETAAYLNMRRTHAKRLGVYAMTANVIQVTHKPGGLRFSVRVEFIFIKNDGTELGRNTAHYLCHYAENGNIRVESLELLDIGLPFLTSMRSALKH